MNAQLTVQNLCVQLHTEAGVAQGPMIDDQAIAKVESHVADALAKGAAAVVVIASRER